MKKFIILILLLALAGCTTLGQVSDISLELRQRVFDAQMAQHAMTLDHARKLMQLEKQAVGNALDALPIGTTIKVMPK